MQNNRVLLVLSGFPLEQKSIMPILRKSILHSTILFSQYKIKSILGDSNILYARNILVEIEKEIIGYNSILAKTKNVVCLVEM